MASIEVRDILNLATVDADHARTELAKMYDWRHEYLSTAAKAIIGAGASLLVAMIAAATQHDSKDHWWPIGLGTAGAIIVVFYGVVSYARTNRIYREYITAQLVLDQALDVTTFLRRFASSV